MFGNVSVCNLYSLSSVSHVLTVLSIIVVHVQMLELEFGARI